MRKPWETDEKTTFSGACWEETALQEKTMIIIIFWSADIWETLTCLVLHKAMGRPIETPKRIHHWNSKISLWFPMFLQRQATRLQREAKLKKNAMRNPSGFFLCYEKQQPGWMGPRFCGSNYNVHRSNRSFASLMCDVLLLMPCPCCILCFSKIANGIKL